MRSKVALESREVWSLLDQLVKDKSTGVSAQAAQAWWQEMTNIVAIFRQFGAKEQVGQGVGVAGWAWLRPGGRK